MQLKDIRLDEKDGEPTVMVKVEAPYEDWQALLCEISPDLVIEVGGSVFKMIKVLNRIARKGCGD